MTERSGHSSRCGPREAGGRRLLIRAAGVVDAAGIDAAPGAVLLEEGRILAAGAPETVGRIDDAEIVDRPNAVVVPALVNAHAHLDLTHLGPVNYSGSFVEWIDFVRTGRTETESDIADSVRAGIHRSRAGGVAMIGDIAGEGSLFPARVMREEGMAGVSFVEVFGLGARQAMGIEALRRVAGEADRPEALGEGGGVRLGVQPHAPYSCGPEVYAFAASLGLPLATHIAETPEEIEFVRNVTGPMAEFLQRLGILDDTAHPTGSHPVEALAETLRASGPLTVHLNYVDESHFDTIAGWGGAVVYCPRASAYFGHPADGRRHRYRDMLDAGIRVALGTDSILCLDTPDRITPLDDMRFLWRRDGTAPRTLLAMATTIGADALGFDPGLVTLSPGPTAGLLALQLGRERSADPLADALARNDAPEWLVEPVGGAAIGPQATSATFEAS